MLKLFRSKLAAIRAAMWKSRLGERFGFREEEPLPRSAFLQTGWLDRVHRRCRKALARREPARRRLLGRLTRSRTLLPPQLLSGRWRSCRVRHQLAAWHCKLQAILNKL